MSYDYETDVIGRIDIPHLRAVQETLYGELRRTGTPENQLEVIWFEELKAALSRDRDDTMFKPGYDHDLEDVLNAGYPNDLVRSRTAALHLAAAMQLKPGDVKVNIGRCEKEYRQAVTAMLATEGQQLAASGPLTRHQEGFVDRRREIISKQLGIPIPDADTGPQRS